MSHSPETRARIAESLREYYANPEIKQTHTGILRDRGPRSATCELESCGATFNARGYNVKYCPDHRAQTHAESRIRGFLMKTYKVSYADYIAHRDAIKNSCEICGISADSARHGRLHNDHDHATGRLRGLLCESCNFVLGKMQDSPQLLRAAADYLERPNPFRTQEGTTTDAQ